MMKRFSSITVRMLSTLLVLLFVVGRNPEVMAYDGYLSTAQQDPSSARQIIEEEQATIEVGHTPDDAPFKHKHHRIHPKGKHHRKIWRAKSFQLKFNLSVKQEAVLPVFLSDETAQYGHVFSYYYLFFREINPPPPKRA